MPAPLTILVVHNHYQQRGGEDSVFETECAMLRNAGHTVICYEKHNDEINSGEKRLAASGQRLEAPTAQVLGTRYQVLANTRFPKKDNPQALAPSPYHLAPSSTPTHPHTHTLSPENFSQSCQSCNPVKKAFRAFLCFSWQKSTTRRNRRSRRPAHPGPMESPAILQTRTPDSSRHRPVSSFQRGCERVWAWESPPNPNRNLSHYPPPSAGRPCHPQGHPSRPQQSSTHKDPSRRDESVGARGA